MAWLTAAQVYPLIKWGVLLGIGLAFVGLLLLSVVVRYTEFVRIHPWKFAVETLAVGTLGALPIFLVSHHRGALSILSLVDFFILTAKFMLLWALFEFSGANSVFFKPRVRKTQSL